MALLDFIHVNNDNKRIIYVLDRLHDFAVRDWSHKNIDFKLYALLNSPKVYQEAFHIGLLPIVSDNKEASPEFMQFVNKIWMYIVYDMDTDFLWAKTANDPIAQRSLHEKISTARKGILQYLFDKGLMPEDQYLAEMEYVPKDLSK